MSVNNEEKKVPDNKNENKKDNNGKSFSFMGVILGLFFIIFAFNVLFLSLVGGAQQANSGVLTSEMVESLKTATYTLVDKDTTFRCTAYTPIFDKEGVKQYEVRFKDMNSDLYFTAVVNASEIDEKGNIEKDAKYQGTVSYLYVENVFENVVKDMDETQKDNRIISLLNGKSEYSSFGTISTIDFMYGEGVSEYSYEKATEYLNKYIEEVTAPKEEPTSDIQTLFPFLNKAG